MKAIIISFILSTLDVITSNYHWNYVGGNRGFLQHRLICDSFEQNWFEWKFHFKMQKLNTIFQIYAIKLNGINRNLVK